MAGSLDGRARRVRRLETRARERGRSPAPSRTQEEIWAIDAEIARLEREMLAEGIDPYRELDKEWTNSAGHPMLSLDEHIAIARRGVRAMSGRLDGRVSRLENARQVPCEECGFDGAWSDVEVVWVDPGASDPADLKRCGTCDTQLEYIVTWADIPPTPTISAEEGL